MAEITDKGYLLLNQNAWFDKEKTLYTDIDADWNLDASTPDGLKLASDAELYADLDEVLQQAYNSKNINSARGNDLDILCELTGTTRSIGTFGDVLLTLTTSRAGVIIPAGSEVKDKVTGTVWAASGDLGPSPVTGTFTGSFTCTTRGNVSANVGDISEIQDVVSGWVSATNLTVPNVGVDKQSDGSLRLEQKLSVAKQSNNQIDSVYAELFNIEGVRKVLVATNASDQIDINGVPARNTYALVDGGVQIDVSRAIFNTKSIGTPWYHAATVKISEDVASLKYPTNVQRIEWCRPDYVDMLVEIRINGGANLPSNTAEKIKESIVEYAQNGVTSQDNAFNEEGFNIGENVALNRLNTPINYVIGPYGSSSYVSLLRVNGITDSFVNIPFNALSRWNVANIQVVIFD